MTDWAFLDDDDEDDEGTALLGGRNFPHLAPKPVDAPFILVLSGRASGRVVQVEDRDFVLGRSEEARLVLDDEGISRRHARLFQRGGMLWLEDLGSTNGTLVNQTRIDDAVPLKHGDRVRLGDCELVTFSIAAPDARDFPLRVYRAATRDPVLGIFRRHVLVDRIAEETSYATRHRASLSVIAVQAANAEMILQRLGRNAGAFALRALSEKTLLCVRSEDLVARLGEHRLGVLCRSTSRSEAVEVARRLEAELVQGRTVFEGQPLDLTPVFGIAAIPTERDGEMNDLLAAAERALASALGEDATR